MSDRLFELMLREGEMEWVMEQVAVDDFKGQLWLWGAALAGRKVNEWSVNECERRAEESR